ncbi:hypothetical protein A3C87_01110 [Candidatus Kaiserbacteria bacterium RIFCSPHIGHO2_02_FULL_49_34]|uniref:peptidoglycan glycosyltransferase n=1 Tax=Candidatus Kaiserbacteria bacterium RIFCSPHIGHO2_02_FULL_49_34 TaxID=1798491 RepID=A0A1F6DIQ2_9BACT|nr:MAG: hypothetical protein A3C87_01110 [Candidatus Kaiserbacteria bacterium RIFCSPHIGHO2_02_FULL_49_34]
MNLTQVRALSKKMMHSVATLSKTLLNALLACIGTLIILLTLTVIGFYTAPFFVEWLTMTPILPGAIIIGLWVCVCVLFVSSAFRKKRSSWSKYIGTARQVCIRIPLVLGASMLVLVTLHLTLPSAAVVFDRFVSAVIANRLYAFDVRTGWLSARLGLAPFNASDLRTKQLAVPSRIYDADGTEIGCFARDYRTYLPLTKELQNLPIVHAVLASEDAGFYQHRGFDLHAIARAALGNIVGGRVESGASTLTMQLVKNFYLTNERSYLRKMREVVLATYVEHTLTKEEILELYLNFVYFGGGYGIEAAAQSYFAKPAMALSPAEAAFIAGLINYPNIYQLHGEQGAMRAMMRKDRVLARMHDRDVIDNEVYAAALREPLAPTRFTRACTDSEPFVRQEINRQLGVVGKVRLAEAGLSIHTTLKRDHQRALEEACKATLTNYLTRHGERAETVRCAAISVESKSGNVVALVPGQDATRDQWSGVTQSQRQAGSSFKPILYAAFLEKRLHNILIERLRFCEETDDREACIAQYEAPIDLLEGCTARDAPVAVPSIVGWKDRIVRRHVVKNYPYEARPRYRGEISCGLALAESRNAAAMWVLGQLSNEEAELAHWQESEASLVAMAERLGIVSALRHYNVTGKTEEDRAKRLPNYTLAVGSAEVTLWEMAQANLPFVTGGVTPQISLVASLTDMHGNTRELSRRAPERVLEPEIAWGMQRLLAGVVDDPLGTAHSLRRKENFPEGALCGKTGTATNADASATDNWFIGCTADYLVVVRVNDISKLPLGRKETGGRNALPVFAHYARTLNLVDPKSTFVVPDIPHLVAPEEILPIMK